MSEFQATLTLELWKGGTVTKDLGRYPDRAEMHRGVYPTYWRLRDEEKRAELGILRRTWIHWRIDMKEVMSENEYWCIRWIWPAHPEDVAWLADGEGVPMPTRTPNNRARYGTIEEGTSELWKLRHRRRDQPEKFRLMHVTTKRKA